eukprot:CAMPEP_0206631542 /NCGR_PEP_ID=MMETSP0325_2-20121206/68288_1 /ASSEMBLY_ACC=CAM_ASM_000347 /TAXON_ID=2866 /ORGANISM="Crypthecodinium cohnii, Strain Seligo" /LENGTH=61 /DNA_ID=CAMNT_0054156727 /DNA_START=368 /DNA_END=549 /DNA_ORIENTATION=+
MPFTDQEARVLFPQLPTIFHQQDLSLLDQMKLPSHLPFKNDDIAPLISGWCDPLGSRQALL